jgi:hypothetical protein
MTEKRSISLPDEVAAILDSQENASAYVAEAIQMRERRRNIDEMLRDHGYTVTDEGVARMRRRFNEQRARRFQRLADEAREQSAA